MGAVSNTICSGTSYIDRRRSHVVQWVRRRLIDGRPSDISASKIHMLRDFALRKTRRPKILIVGGGEAGMGTDSLFRDPDVDVISFDVYASDVTTFVADAHTLPIQSSVFDAACVQFVLEHVLEPQRVVAEVHRVLRHDGILFVATPFLQHVHEGAHDFNRFTHSGHRWLLKDFEEIDSGVLMGPSVQLLWTIDYWVRGLTRSRRAGKMAKVMFSWLQLFDALIPANYAIDAASALYFLGRAIDTPLGAEEMRSYYRGSDHKS